MFTISFCSAPRRWGSPVKLASAAGTEEISTRVPSSLNISSATGEAKMGRKKIQISRINDERNRQVII